MKKTLWAVALVSLLSFTACNDDASNNPTGGNQNTPGNTEKGKETKGPCGFEKSDKVWEYTYSTWKYTNKYTWIDETTVKYEEYAGSYHMEDSDSTMTDQNRDELFETVMEDCLYYTNENNL